MTFGAVFSNQQALTSDRDRSPLENNYLRTGSRNWVKRSAPVFSGDTAKPCIIGAANCGKGNDRLFNVLKAVVRKVVRILPFKRSWWLNLDLLKTLVQRDLEARYKGSALGNLWPLVNQLAQLFVYTYVFSIILKVKLALTGLPQNNFTFGLWMFAGLIPWTAFTAGLIQSSSSVIGQPSLVKKVVFPLALLPLVPILSALVESSLGLMLLITFVALTAKTIHATLLLLPLVLIPQFLLTAGLSYLAAGFTVFLRDIPQTLMILLNLGFYMTPIVYPASIIPDSLMFWVRLNPLAIIVEIYRDLILDGTVEHWTEWGIMSCASLLIFSFGLYIYGRLRPAFADVM